MFINRSQPHRPDSPLSSRRRPHARRHPAGIDSLERRQLLTIAFNFIYRDVNQNTDTGFDDPSLGAARRQAFESTAADFGALFLNDATISLNVTSFNDASDGTLASANSRRPASGTAGFNNPSFTEQKILTGVDGNGSNAEGFIDVNFGIDFSLDGTVAFNQDDFIATVAHELAHVLGFSGNIRQNGTSDITGSDSKVYGRFDEFVADSSGVSVIDVTGDIDDTRWAAARASSGSTPSLFFNGPNAVAANNGQLVPLFSPSTFDISGSVSHVDDDAPGISFATHLMVASGQTGTINARTLHPVEVGIFRDIGYSLRGSGDFIVSQTTDPLSVSESGTQASFTVVLDSQPLTDVVINVQSQDPGEVSVSSSALTFTRQNWNVARTVTVTGQSDGVFDGSQTTSIVVSVNDNASDDQYDLAANQSVSVTTSNIDPFVAVVTTLNDEEDANESIGSDDLSLREAISLVNSSANGGRITFDPALTASGPATLPLTLGRLIVFNTMQIDGPGANRLSIDAGGTSGLFEILNGDFELSGLTLTGGSDTEGGAILATGVLNLALRNSTVRGNTATAFGGALLAEFGSLVIEDSTFSGNSARVGGGMFVEAADVTITNSTFSGNTAREDGGGIATDQADIVLIHSTFTNNSAASGGGAISFFNDTSVADTESLTVTNSIVAGNTGTDAAPDVLRHGEMTVTTQSSLVGGPAFMGSIDLLLGSLADNGGPTHTHAPLTGSPAIDAADDSLVSVTTDQRGIARPQMSGFDIGAVEVILVETTVSLDGSGNLVITDTQSATDDRLMVTVNGSNQFVITDEAALLTTEIAGATITNNGRTVLVPVSAVTGGRLLVNTGDGDDSFDGSTLSVPIQVQAGDGNDSIMTGSGSDTLEGEAGLDSLHGGRGGDILRGGSGNDTLIGGPGNDQLLGEGDDDVLLGRFGRDSLFGNDGNDFLAGGAGRDRLFGGFLNDVVLGQDGNDTLNGDAGTDSLVAGAGTDVLTDADRGRRRTRQSAVSIGSPASPDADDAVTANSQTASLSTGTETGNTVEADSGSSSIAVHALDEVFADAGLSALLSPMP